MILFVPQLNCGRWGCRRKFPSSSGNMQTKTALGGIRGPLFVVAVQSLGTGLITSSRHIDQSSIPSRRDRPPWREAFFSSGGTGAGAAGSVAGIMAGAAPGAQPFVQPELQAVAQPLSQQPLTTS